jgi:Flp pilus assembly protein TadG
MTAMPHDRRGVVTAAARSVRAVARRATLVPRFAADQRAATAVEFGLIALPFFAVLLAVFELGFADFQNEMLANGVDKAARAMLTGNLQTANISTVQGFKNAYLCAATGGALPGNFNCANLIVDVRPAASFAAGDTANDFYKSANNQFCPGQPGQIMVVRVAYPLPAIMPLNLFNRTAGVVNDVPGLAGNYHILMSAALFQEENYAGGYTSPAGC